MQRFKHTRHFPGLKVAVGVVLLISASFAMAHSPRVNWSVTIGTPYPAPVYGPPPVIYAEPEVVYLPPRPLYVETRPVMQYRPHPTGSYYVEERYYKRPKHHKHRKHHRHHSRHHDRWHD